jgi:hypothetical protein
MQHYFCAVQDLRAELCDWVRKMKHTSSAESFEIIVIIKTCSYHVVVDMKNEHAKYSKEDLNIMALHNLAAWRDCECDRSRHLRNIRNFILPSFYIEHSLSFVFANVHFLAVLWS